MEFGAGDGSPVISALLKSTKAPPQMPDNQAYEISPSAAHLATTRAASVGLGDVYRVHNSCFWTGAVKEGRPEDKCLIANPPYIPAPGEKCGEEGGRCRGVSVGEWPTPRGQEGWAVWLCSDEPAWLDSVALMKRCAHGVH